MTISIHHRPLYDPVTEFVERKGAGHPDTICDSLAEHLANNLATYYISRRGGLKHFNVDKALLSAGQAKVGFWRGEIIKPSRIILAGKVDAREGLPPLGKFLANAYTQLGKILPWAQLPGDYSIELSINPSSDDLVPLLERGTGNDGVPLANDTSFAVAHWPRSPLEEAVLEVETVLNSPRFRAEVPVGADIKVMGYREGDVVRLTVAAAIRARQVHNRMSYQDSLTTIQTQSERVVREVFYRRRRALAGLEVWVNRADRHPRSYYLTLTGSSAEAGDDGQVGRGNRMGGLITPHRAMSLEATAGKNPAGHVGKLYHAIAWDAAQDVASLDGIDGASVYLLSEIGRPVTQPVAVQVEVQGLLMEQTRCRIVETIKRHLSDWSSKVDKLIMGRIYPLF